jgi:hypothetical protein
MKLYYSEDRDEDFLLACDRLRKATPGYPRVRDIARDAILQPARSFYLSPVELRRALHEIRRGVTPRFRSPAKNALRAALRARLAALEQARPGIPVRLAAAIISDQPAPRFYISVARATSLYYHALKNRKPAKPPLPTI